MAVATPVTPEVGFEAGFESPSRSSMIQIIRARSNTPNILMASLAGMIVVAVLTLFLGNWAIGSARDAIRTISGDTAPTIVAAQAMKASMANMDAEAANDLLGGKEGVSAARTEYEVDRAKVMAGLVLAASKISSSEEQALVESLQNNMSVYLGHVAQARTHRSIGDPVVAAASLKTATDLMHKEIIPAVEKLDAINLQELESTYASYRRSRAIGFFGTALLVVILLVGLVRIQVFMMQRFPAILTPPLIVASLIALFMSYRLLEGLYDAGEELKVAKEQAFASIHNLWEVRAIAYDANADKSYYLLSGFDKPQYDASFQAKARQLVDRPLADQLTNAVPKAAEFGGKLGEALRNPKNDEERKATADALRAWAWYTLADLRIRTADRFGRTEVAIIDATGNKLGESNWAFEQFDSAFGRMIDANQLEFDAAIGRASSAIWFREFTNIIGVLVIIGCLVWAMWPRIREYQV